MGERADPRPDQRAFGREPIAYSKSLCALCVRARCSLWRRSILSGILELERGGDDWLGPLGRGRQVFWCRDFAVDDVQQENGCGQGAREIRLGGIVPEDEFGDMRQKANKVQATVLPALPNLLFRNIVPA